MSNTVTITLGSVSTDDLRTFLLIWHRTRDYGLPRAITPTSPAVRVMGADHWTIECPPVWPDRAAVILADFDRQRVGTLGESMSVAHE